MNRLLLPLIVLLVTAAPGFAGTIVQERGAATLEVHFEGDKPKIALPDLITATLTIEGSPALDVYKAPLDLPTAGPWALVQRSKVDLKKIDPARVRWRLVYRFAPREPGAKVPFQFPDVTFRDGDEQIASWTPIDFEVQTELGASPGAPRDITAIEALPAAPPESAWRWWLGGGAACVAFIVAIAVWRSLRRRHAERTAVQVALYEWQRLAALKLPEKGRSERFITLLTLLVRRYVERQFSLPARSLTTPEFIRRLENASSLTPEQKHFLIQFLARSEAVKFAQEAMSVDECHDWARSARDFLSSRRAGRSA